MKVIIQKEAKENIRNIYNYLFFNIYPKYAEKTTRKIYSKIHILKNAPYIGRYVPEFEDKSYRELLYKRYRIIYSIAQEEFIYIHFVIHSSRHINKILNSNII